METMARRIYIFASCVKRIQTGCKKLVRMKIKFFMVNRSHFKKSGRGGYQDGR
jgi:hypothetical protein